MYLNHYHLKDKPFQISADPRFLWLGGKHKEALAILKYGIFDNRGFLLLSGDVGTGKTTLIHALLRSLGSDTLVAMVPDPGLSLVDFYRYIARSFEITKPFETKEQFLALFKAFLLWNEEREKKVLLIIDEAQRLTSDLLEEVRLLSNIEKDYTKLLNIFFVGQNEFNNIILEQRNRPLRQRITINYNIEPLEKNEVMEYVRYRLAVAGSEAPIFTADAIHDVYAFSEGYPRLINIICDHALLTAFVQGASQVDDAVVRECAAELRIKLVTPMSTAPPAIETLVHPAPPGPPTPLPVTLAPVPPPPETNMPSSQTLLLIVFGLLCFLAGLLAFTLRERPQTTASNAGNVVATDTAPNSHQSTGTAKAAETDDRPVLPPRSESVLDVVDDTIPATDVAPADGGATETVEGVSAAEDGAFALSVGEDGVPADAASVDIPLPPKLIIYFDLDSNELADETLRELDQLAEAIKQHPHLPIRIVGYTDTGGNMHYNLKVSEFRANIIKSFLVGKGIDPGRIASRGLGPASPIASNDTLQGRALNRRVEIELVEE